MAAVEDEIAVLLARSDAQVLTSLPGVAANRAAAFAAHSLPIASFPDAEHLYSATGLAPAMYESATIRRRGRISRQGLAEHPHALMGIAWGLSLYSPSFAERNAELRARGMAPIQARVALARHACRLIYRILVTQQPFDEEAFRRGRHSRGRRPRPDSQTRFAANTAAPPGRRGRTATRPSSLLTGRAKASRD